MLIPVEPGAYAVLHHVYDGKQKLVGVTFEGVVMLSFNAEQPERQMVPISILGPRPDLPICGPHEEVTFEGHVFHGVDAYIAWARQHAH